jgi:hypothetical protein
MGIDVTVMRRGEIVAERTYAFDPAAEASLLGLAAAPAEDAATTTA